MTNKFIEQRVETLENELSELKLIVAQIRKPSTVVEEVLANDIIEFEGKQYKKVDREAREGDVAIARSTEGITVEQNTPYKVIANKNGLWLKHGCFAKVYNARFGRTQETVDVYELIVEDKPFFVPEPIKTANQLRAEIIEKAKGFVEKYQAVRNGNENELNGREGGNETFREHWYETLFFTKGNKVTAVIYRLVFGKIRPKNSSNVGRAKCHPEAVFNVWIGKAIALGRALGLDVNEFEQAVQPDEVVVGTYTHHFKNGELSFEHTVVDEEDAKETNAEQNSCGWTFKIINDSNAQYEVNQ